MDTLLILLVVLVKSLAAQQPVVPIVPPKPEIHICPDNTVYYNLKPCNPMEPNNCPNGFACRWSRLIEDGKPTEQFNHLCCNASTMSIADWLTELQLSPQVIPQAPKSTIFSVRLNKFDYDTPSPDVRINDEVTAIEFANFVIATVQSIQLYRTQFAAGGFLHLLVLVDASNKQCAMFLDYDIACEGSTNGYTAINISNSAKEHSFFGAISKYPVQPQQTYRHQYVVLLYHTDQQLSAAPPNNVSSEISAYLEQLPTFLSSSSIGRQLGQPLAGTFFYVVSQRSMFPIDAQTVAPESGASSPFSRRIPFGYSASFWFPITIALLLYYMQSSV